MEPSGLSQPGESAKFATEPARHVNAQWQQADECRSYAADLHHVVRNLMFKTTVSPARLQNLARRILLDAKELTAAQILPVPGSSIASNLSSRDWQSEPAVYSTGIETARLLAFVAPQMFGWTDRAELLVIAALMQDVGLFPLERRFGLPPGKLAIDEPAAYRQHPSIGAALAAAFTDYAVDLPTIIAEHHERCDGTGSPHGKFASHLSAPSRFLAIACRFVELLHDSGLRPEDGRADFDRPATISTAARRLRREAEQGELDAPLTGMLLARLCVAPGEAESPASSRHFQLARFGEKRFRRDDAIGKPLNDVREEEAGADALRNAPSPHFAGPGLNQKSPLERGAATER